MKIKKIANSVGLVGNVTNEYSESKQDSYSCDYLNNVTGFTPKILNMKGGSSQSISASTTAPLNFAQEIENTASDYLEWDSTIIGFKVKKDCVINLSGSIYYNATGTSTNEVSVCVNNYTDLDNITYTKYRTIFKINNSYDGTSIGSVTFTVQTNDVIYLVAKAASATTEINTNRFVCLSVLGDC